MGILIEQQAVIDCLTNTAKYYDMPQADEWTKGIHYGLLHGIDNILDNVKPVEAISKAEVKKFLEEGTKEASNNVLAIVREDYIHKSVYEARLKADMVAILVELQTEMEEYEPKWVENDEQAIASCRTWEDLDDIIQQKINALRGEK